MSDADEGEKAGCMKMRIVEYHNHKTLLGPCLISFSLPLLIPGVTLTVVGSVDNDVTFQAFGGWHIAGIVILTIALLLLLCGILLKCCFRPIISADIEKHLTPMHSRVTGSKNLGYEGESVEHLGAVLNNKVGHHDPAGSHRVVSTHDKKEVPNKSKNNSNIGNTDNKTSKPQVPVSSDNQRSRKDDVGTKPYNERAVDVGDELEENKRNRHTKKHRNDHPSTPIGHDGEVTSHPSGIITKVTASITAEAEASAHSSDPAENSSFIPEVKKKKKKKRKKRNSNLSSASVAQSLAEETEGKQTTGSRNELPVLRSPPNVQKQTDGTIEEKSEDALLTETRLKDEISHRSALVNEGESHHHSSHLHVHFPNTPEVTSRSPERDEIDV
ncbi:hypothetical protein MAR_030217 [Mya arenaria]|uniref:Uncharacterized protein n=1 Tax=Mya arenaria TaxID=6604 RepID=A0ABY7DIJ7_MYAAR|nr:uncharacterized protein LOC128219658 [Mya arenaria]WAQ97527.1 hypothetical protein MAR_030217 [Mya arenaria]